jgi:predicted TIM-barrel fold metal-dependent hydrolase
MAGGCPRRVIPGTAFQTGPGTPPEAEQLKMLNIAFTRDGFKVMGEIGLQYQGTSPSDMSVDSYFALAEKLDVPVAIHMGTGGSGRANVAMPAFRGWQEIRCCWRNCWRAIHACGCR